MRTKTTAAILCFALFASLVGIEISRAQDVTANGPVAAHVDHAGLGKLGWQLACQTQTFHDMTFFDMIDLLHAQAFHHVELAPGQLLSPERKDVKVGADMAADDLAAISGKLKSVKMGIVGYGVVRLNDTEADARKVFEVAKKLKAKNIVVDPSSDSMALLDKLATEYNIKVAIVNGKKGSAYADPDALLNLLAPRSDHVGTCVVLGDYAASGFNALDAVKKLGKRVIELRLTDVDEHGNQVPLGTGVVHADRVLEYLKQQNFKGIFVVEYDSDNGPETANNFFLSVNYFSEIVGHLAGTHQ